MVARLGRAQPGNDRRFVTQRHREEGQRYIRNFDASCCPKSGVLPVFVFLFKHVAPRSRCYTISQDRLATKVPYILWCYLTNHRCGGMALLLLLPIPNAFTHHYTTTPVVQVWSGSAHKTWPWQALRGQAHNSV